MKETELGSPPQAIEEVFSEEEISNTNTDRIENIVQSAHAHEPTPSQSINTQHMEEEAEIDDTDCEPVCYCGETLQSEDTSEFEGAWRCKHCFNKHEPKRGEIYYNCLSGQVCTYYQITKTYYDVCSQCYEQGLKSRPLEECQKQKRLLHLKQKQEEELMNGDYQDEAYEEAQKKIYLVYDEFVLATTESHIKYIENVVLKQKENEKQEIRYLEEIYCFFYENFLCALKNEEIDVMIHDLKLYDKVMLKWKDFYCPVYERRLYD